MDRAQPSGPRGSRGFSLIELLVVMAVMSILASMLLSGIDLVREAARGASCASTQRQIGLAVMAYAGEWDGMLCPGYIQNNVVTNHPELGISPVRHLAWSDDERIGGYLDGRATAGGSFTAPPYAGAPWRCPSDRRVAGSTLTASISYGINTNLALSCIADDSTYADAWRKSGPLSRWRVAARLALIADTQEVRWFPASTVVTSPPTIVFADQTQPNSWTSPTQRPNYVYNRHRRRANLVFADGHCESTATLPQDVLDRIVFVRTSDIP